MSDRKLAFLALSAVWVKLIWMLHPHADIPFDQIPTYQMFPLRPDILISKPTYIATACGHIVWLIFATVCYFKFEQFKKAFAALFIIQLIQFFEYFANYNEPFAWQIVNLFGHETEIGFTLIKLVVPMGIFIYQLAWEER
jgi:hypothetical protein